MVGWFVASLGFDWLVCSLVGWLLGWLVAWVAAGWLIMSID